MPAVIEKVMGKPVVIVTYHGHITVEDAKSAAVKTADLLDTYGGPLYKVMQVDCDHAYISFDEVMMLTTLSSKGRPGSVTDERIRPVFVGEHLLLDLYVDAMKQEAFGAIEIPVFDTLDDAMIYVDERIHEDGAYGSV
jgi:hypothetical protein